MKSGLIVLQPGEVPQSAVAAVVCAVFNMAPACVDSDGVIDDDYVSNDKLTIAEASPMVQPDGTVDIPQLRGRNLQLRIIRAESNSRVVDLARYYSNENTGAMGPPDLDFVSKLAEVIHAKQVGAPTRNQAKRSAVLARS